LAQAILAQALQRLLPRFLIVSGSTWQFLSAVRAMAKMIALSVFASGAAVQGAKCPGSSAFVHASCSTEVTVAKASCKAVMDEMKQRVASQAAGGWYDPHNKGTYVVDGEDANELDLHRVTGDKKYTDKMTFTFQDKGCGTAGCSCAVTGCSESQVTSIADFSTNYCNLRMLYCGKNEGCKPVTDDGKDFSIEETRVKPSLGASHDPSACLKMMMNETQAEVRDNVSTQPVIFL